jgi:hypothetical protein
LRYPHSVLSIFATAKPFLGHIGIIQRNAIQSWTRLHPDVEVILFGNDEGAAALVSDLSRDFSIRHEPHVECNELGTKRLDYLFARAQSIARHDLLCYINCDIILTSDFCRALQRVHAAHKEFLMVGRRTDLDITAPLNFQTRDSEPQQRLSALSQPARWEKELRTLAQRSGRKRTAEWIDYFAFTRGLYTPDMPPFVLRVHWDNWLVWKALSSGKVVVDASQAVLAIHQNHDYSHHPQGQQGVWHGTEAADNARLAGSWRNLRTIADATEMLTADKLRNNYMNNWSTVTRYARQFARLIYYDVWHPIWFALLKLTRPLRDAFHLRARP